MDRFQLVGLKENATGLQCACSELLLKACAEAEELDDCSLGI